MTSIRAEVRTSVNGNDVQFLFKENRFLMKECNSGSLKNCSSKTEYEIGDEHELKMRLMRQSIPAPVRGKLNIDLEFTDLHSNHAEIKFLDQQIAKLSKYPWAVGGKEDTEFKRRKAALEKAEADLKKLPEYADYLEIEKAVDKAIAMVKSKGLHSSPIIEKLAANFFYPQWKSGIESGALYDQHGDCEVKTQHGKFYFKESGVEESDFHLMTRDQMLLHWKACLHVGYVAKKTEARVNDADRSNNKVFDDKHTGARKSPAASKQ